MSRPAANDDPIRSPAFNAAVRAATKAAVKAAKVDARTLVKTEVAKLVVPKERKHAVRDDFLDRKWPELLGLIREGSTVANALSVVGATHGLLTSAVRSSPDLAAAWEAAKMVRLWKKWDVETIEEVMVAIAMGGLVKKTLEDRALDPVGFYTLVLKDPLVKAMYDEAQQIRMEGMSDEIIEISDPKEADVLPNGRTNHDLVARDKLMTDSRKWLMARLNWKRFGDRLQTEQNVNLTVDHIARLDTARKRREKVIQGRAEVVSVGPAVPRIINPVSASNELIDQSDDE